MPTDDATVVAHLLCGGSNFHDSVILPRYLVGTSSPSTAEPENESRSDWRLHLGRPTCRGQSVDINNVELSQKSTAHYELLTQV